LFESEVDSHFAYVAMKEESFSGDVKGLHDALGGGIDGCGVEEVESGFVRVP
jgi:hypothetical protein